MEAWPSSVIRSSPSHLPPDRWRRITVCPRRRITAGNVLMHKTAVIVSVIVLTAIVAAHFIRFCTVSAAIRTPAYGELPTVFVDRERGRTAGYRNWPRSSRTVGLPPFITLRCSSHRLAALAVVSRVSRNWCCRRPLCQLPLHIITVRSATVQPAGKLIVTPVGTVSAIVAAAVVAAVPGYC